MKQFIIFIAFIVLGLAITAVITGDGDGTFSKQVTDLSTSVITDIGTIDD